MQHKGAGSLLVGSNRPLRTWNSYGIPWSCTRCFYVIIMLAICD